MEVVDCNDVDILARIVVGAKSSGTRRNPNAGDRPLGMRAGMIVLAVKAYNATLCIPVMK